MEVGEGCFCRSGCGFLRAFSMSDFARCFVVHPVQAFVWPHAHIRLMCIPARASVAVLSVMQRCLGSLKRAKVSAVGRGAAKWPRVLSSPEAFLNRGWRCVRCDVGSCARVGAYGCRGFACGRVPPPRVLAVPQETGADFAMGPWLLCGFRRGCSLSAPTTWGNVGAGWRFRLIRPAKSPRSLQAGLACVEDGLS